MAIEIAIFIITVFSLSIISITYKSELKKSQKNVQGNEKYSEFNKIYNEYSEIRI